MDSTLPPPRPGGTDLPGHVYYLLRAADNQLVRQVASPDNHNILVGPLRSRFRLLLQPSSWLAVVVLGTRLPTQWWSNGEVPTFGSAPSSPLCIADNTLHRYHHTATVDPSYPPTDVRASRRRRQP